MRPLRKTLLLVLAVLAPLIAVLIMVISLPSSPPYFEKITDLVNLSCQHGLHVHSGKQDANAVEGVCFLYDRPLTLEQVSTLIPSQGGLTPAWKGMA